MTVNHEPERSSRQKIPKSPAAHTIPYGFDSPRNSRPALHLARHLPQDRSRRYTPIWFAEDDGKLYFMTSSKLGKIKRIRNNAQVKIAPCTIRGKITGPEFSATARILKPEDTSRPPGHQSKVLAGPCPVPLAQHRHLCRNHARISALDFFLGTAPRRDP